MSINRRSRTSSTLDASSKQIGAVCVEEENGMKFFALGGKTWAFKELRLVFHSPLWFYLFYAH